MKEVVSSFGGLDPEARHRKAIAATWFGSLFGEATVAVLLLATYAAALASLNYATGGQLLELQNAEPWLFWPLLLVPLLAVAVFSVFPTLRRARREARLKLLENTDKGASSGYYRLTPYEVSDRDRFHRSDGAVDVTLQWIRQANTPILYLTGGSGVGKSSLLAAGVVPVLQDESWRILHVRGMGAPLSALQDALRKAPHLFREPPPPSATVLECLFLAAAETKRTDNGSLLIVLDQFEEYLIQESGEDRALYAKFLQDLTASPPPNTILLHVFRSDYRDLLFKYDLPEYTRQTGLGLPAFQRVEAEAFLRAGPQQLSDEGYVELFKGLDRVERARGLYRPITLNMVGFVLNRQGSKLADEPTRLIQRYLRDCIDHGTARDFAPAVLDTMITDAGTKLPREPAEIARSTGIEEWQVKATLAQFHEQGLVRKLGEAWELSHDFIARLLGPIIGRRRTRPHLKAGILVTALLGWMTASGAGLVAYQSAESARLSNQQAEVAAAETARQEDILAAWDLTVQGRDFFEQTAGRNGTAALLGVESLLLGGGSQSRRLLDDVFALMPRAQRNIPWIEGADRVLETPDGNIQLAVSTIGWDARSKPRGAVVIIDKETGEERFRVEQDAWPDSDVSADGRWLAVGGAARNLTIVDLSDFSVVVQERAPTRIDVRFSSDSRSLLVLGSDGTLQKRSAPDWKQVEADQLELVESRGINLELDVAKDGRFLAVLPSKAFAEGIDGSLLELPDIPLSWWNRGRINQDGSRILSLTAGRLAQLHDARDGSVISILADDYDLEGGRFAPSGDRLAIWYENGLIELVGTEDGSKLLNLDAERGSVADVTFSADGERVFARYTSGALRVFSSSDGQLLFERYGIWSGPPVDTSEGNSLLIGDTTGALIRLDLSDGSIETLFFPKDSQRSRTGRIVDIPARNLAIVELGFGNSSFLWTDLTAHDTRTGEVLWKDEVPGRINNLAAGPDSRAFVGWRDGGRFGDDVWLWDTKTGVRRSLPKLFDINEVGYLSNGRDLQVRHSNRKIFDVETTSLRLEFGEPGGIDRIAISADGKTLVSYGSDLLKEWDTETGELLWSRPAQGRPLNGGGPRYAEWDPSTRQILVRNTKSAEVVARIPASAGNLRTEFSTSGDRLLVVHEYLMLPHGEQGWRAELWDVDSEALLYSVVDENRSPFVLARFASDGKVEIAATSPPRRRVIRVEPETGEVLADFRLTDRESVNSPVRGSNAPLYIAQNGTTRLIGAGNSDDVTLDSPVFVLAINRPGQTAFGILERNPGEPRKAGLFDLTNGREIWRTELGDTVMEHIEHAEFTEDGQFLILFDQYGGGAEDPFAVVLDAGGQVVQKLFSPTMIEELKPINGGKTLAVLASNGLLSLWRIGDEAPYAELSHAVVSEIFASHPKSNRVVSGSGTELVVWDATNGKELTRLSNASGFGDVFLSPNGDRLISSQSLPAQSSANRNAERLSVYDLETGQPLGQTQIPDRSAYLAFDPSGERFALRAGANTLRVFETVSVRPIATIIASPGGTFLGPSWSDSGLLVASESSKRDGLGIDRLGNTHLRVWDLEGKSPVEVARVEHLFSAKMAYGDRILGMRDGNGIAVDIRSTGAERLELPGARFCCTGPIHQDRWVAHRQDDAVFAIDTATGANLRIAKSAEATSIAASAFRDDMSAVYIAERVTPDDIWAPGAVWLRAAGSGVPLAGPVYPDITVSEIIPVEGGALLQGSPGGWLVGGRHETAMIWRDQTDELIELKTSGPFRRAAVSPDGRLVALAEGIREQDESRWVTVGTPRISLWQAETGALRAIIPLETPPGGLAFSPDGSMLAFRDQNNVQLVDLETLQADLERPVASDPVVYSGQDFVAGTRYQTSGFAVGFVGSDWLVIPDGTVVRLTHLPSKAEVNLPHDPGASSYVQHVQGVMTDAADLLMTRQGETVRIWRLPNLAELAAMGTGMSVPIPSEPDLLVARFDQFTSNQKPFLVGNKARLYLGSEKGFDRLLYDDQDLIGEACFRVGRGLVEDEIAFFFRDREPKDPCRAAERLQ